MKKGILFLFPLLFIMCFKAPVARAFDTYVIHPSLTRTIVEHHNEDGFSISSTEAEWIVQGSLEEDEPIIRAFNHFYNPINRKGLYIGGMAFGLPSPEWALASLRQRLSPGGDCSWPTALAAYYRQDLARAFRCLGHILHLLEDVGVPAHTRNDQHVAGDLFEQWAKYHDPSPSEEVPSIIPSCQSPQDCIVELATWVNSHFLSEDSVTDKAFSEPLQLAFVEGDYLIHEGHKIAVYHPGRRSFVLTQEIQAEYWRIISPVVVEFGQRLLDIFFTEVGAKEIAVEKVIPSLAPSDPILPPNSVTTRSVTPVIASGEVSSPTPSLLNAPPSSVATLPPLIKIVEPVVSQVLPTSTAVPSVPVFSFQSQKNINSPSLPDTYFTTRPPSRTNIREADFVIASDQSAETFECQLDDGDWITCSNHYHLFNLSAGEHTLKARAISSAGQDQTPISYTWTIDLTPPVTFLVASTDEHSRTAQFTFTAELGAHFECRLDNEGWQECFSPQTYEDLGAGIHTFQVRAIDSVGNIEALPSAHWWAIEIDPPQPPSLLSPDELVTYTNMSPFTLQGEKEAGLHVVINDQVIDAPDTDREWSYEQPLVPGDNQIRLQTQNQYGELSETVTVTVVYDMSAPTAQIKNLAEVYEIPDFIVYWQGFDNSPTELLQYDIRYQVNDDWYDWQQNTSFTQAFFTNAPLNQELSFQVRAHDKAGNIGEWSETVTTRYATGSSEHIVISQLTTRGAGGNQDEFIELYNPTDRTVYLSGFTIEKKAAAGLLWNTIVSADRFEHMVIQPYGYFLITSNDYSYSAVPDLKVTEELAFDSGGHIRLVGALDEEIDRLGYGSAITPEGFPAPVPPFGSSLERKAHYGSTAESLRENPQEGNGYDSDSNYFDFVIQPDIMPRSSDYQAGPINLNNNLVHLWHFDECQGQTKDEITGHLYSQPAVWIVGKYGCALSQHWFPDQDISWSLDTPISGSEVTISLYAREPDLGAHSYLWFLDNEGQVVAGVRTNRTGDEVWYQGAPIHLNSSLPWDGEWHQITVVFNYNYLAWYRDGVLVQKIAGDYHWLRSATTLSINEDNIPWHFDQLAIWLETLSSQEIADLATHQLSPHLIRPPQVNATLLHYWNFDEPGTTAIDSIHGRPLLYPEQVEGHTGAALAVRWYYSAVSTPINVVNSKDISLSYWWHRGDGELSGASIDLLNNNNNILFGSGGGYIQSFAHFNGDTYYLGTQLPHDDAWHHIALVYDSYQYKLRYYVDGEERAVREFVWAFLPYSRLLIREDQHGFYVDDLKIWQGALTPAQVRHEAGLE